MLRDTVRLAQSNRRTKDIVVQKVTIEFAIRLETFRSVRTEAFDAGFFRADEARVERRKECTYRT